MPLYEHVVLARQDVSAQQVEDLTSQLKGVVEQMGGKVTKVELINPHSWIHIDVQDDKGNTVAWMIEGGSPNALVRRGINKNSIPIGSELVIRGYGTRDGTNKAVGRDIRFADGRELFFSGSQPDAAQP